VITVPQSHTPIKMTDDLGTESSYVDVEYLAPILEPFGLSCHILLGLLRETSAVLVGGAVTHYLWNQVMDQETAVPGTTSDLDFWVYSPRDSTTGYQHHYAFTNFVRNRFTEFFKPLGFTRSLAHESEYDEAKKQFRTKAGIKIDVLWFANEKTGRYFNLVFTNSLPAPMMMKTDIPIGRAMIYFRSIWCGHAEDLAVEYDPLVLDDIRSLKLTPPEPRYAGAATERRVKKYLERYGMTLRTPVTTVTTATSEQMAALPFSGVSGPVSRPQCALGVSGPRIVGACFPVSGTAETRTDRDPLSSWDATVDPLASWGLADPFPTSAPFLTPPRAPPGVLPPSGGPNRSSFHESGGITRMFSTSAPFPTPPRAPSGELPTSGIPPNLFPTPVRPHNHTIPPCAPPRVRRSGHADEDFSVGPEHPIFGLNPRFLPVVPTFAEKDFASVKPPAL